MLLPLLRFEILFHLRQTPFRVATCLFFLAGLAMARGSYGGANVLQNAPMPLAFFVGLLSLGSFIAISLLAGGAILRDREHGMEGIVYATGLTRTLFLTSRFGGFVLVSCFCLASGVLGLYLGRFAPGVDPHRFSGLSPAPYLQVLVAIGLPNVLLGCAVIFATGALTRSALGTYLSGVALYALYWVGSVLGDSPLMAHSKHTTSPNAYLAALLEPLGLVALLEQTRYWSPVEKNIRALPLTGMLLHNRLLWLGAALSLVALTYRLFAFRAATSRRERRAVAATVGLPARVPAHTYRPLAPALASGARTFAALVSHTRLCLKSILHGLPFLGLLLLWIPFTLINLRESLHRGDLNVPLQARAEVFLPALMEPLNMLGTLVVLYFAAELAWRERGAGMEGLVDATPCPPAALQLGRLMALAALILCLVTSSISLAVGVQLLAGSFTLNIPLYLSVFVRCGLPLLEVAALALALQTLASNKYVGLALSFAAVLLWSGMLLPRSPILANPLLRYAAMPAYVGSAMAGGYHDAALPWYALYWCGWATVLVVGSLHLLQRRHASRTRLGCGAYLTGGLGLGLALSVGAVMYRDIYVDASYLEKKALLDWQAGYERAYGAIREEPNPDIARVTLKVDLEPQQRRLRLAGVLELENRSAAPLAEVRVGLDRRVRDRRLALKGAHLTEVDERYGQYRFHFAEPLPVGGRARLEFALMLTTSAFGDLDPEAYVLPSASYVELEKLLPALGFQSHWTIDSPRHRRERGLPPRSELPPATPQSSRRDWVTFDAVFSTALGQTVVAPGRLNRSWAENDRAYFHYGAADPVPLALGVASAAYAERQARAGNVTITAYYHPGHEALVPRQLAGADAALTAYSEAFGPYPDSFLRIAEIPAFSDLFGATAYPGTIFAVESRVFLLQQGPDTQDVAFRIVAHEVAHQWWGRQLDPAPVAGFRLLTETLAEYSQIVLAEKHFGASSTRDHLIWANDLYFHLRGFEDEVERPLYRAQKQPYIYYFKVAEVTYALLQLLGQGTVDRVLRDFLRERRYPEKPIADELVARLEAAAPTEARAAIHEMLTQVVTCELQLLGAEVHPAQGGQRRITLRVGLRRHALDERGQSQELPPGSWLEVGLGDAPDGTERHRVWLGAAEATVDLLTRSRADTVWLDPRRLLVCEPGKRTSGNLAEFAPQ